MYILVVDDKLFRRKQISQLLKNNDYSVRVAIDGLSALSLIKYSNFNLVLTDTKMPCVNGPELVEEIKKLFPHLPVIGMSNREESRKLYQYFWNKNEDSSILLSLIEQLTKPVSS